MAGRIDGLPGRRAGAAAGRRAGARAEAEARAEEERKRRRLTLALAASVLAPDGGRRRRGGGVPGSSGGTRRRGWRLAVREAAACCATRPPPTRSATRRGGGRRRTAARRAGDLLGPLVDAGSRREVQALAGRGRRGGSGRPSATRSCSAPGRHPLGRGRRPGRLGQRRGVCGGVPRGRPGRRCPGPGGGRGADPVQAGGRGAGAGRGPGRLGDPAAVGPAEGRGGLGPAGRRRPRRRPGPDARTGCGSCGRAPTARRSAGRYWSWPRRPIRGPGRRRAWSCWPGPVRGRASATRPSALLRRAQAHHPGDVWINYNLARALEALHPPRTEEAIGYYTAARALRPETAHELAHALEDRGRGEEAVAVFADLVRLRPGNGRHWGCYGKLLKDRGDRAGADAALEKAVAALREAIRVKPDDAEAHANLGFALCEVKRDYPGRSRNTARRSGSSPTTPRPTTTSATPWPPGQARRGHRRIPRGDPAQARLRRGPRTTSGVILCEGKRDYPRRRRNAARRSGSSPTTPRPTTTSASPCGTQGKPDEAIVEYREAIRLKPDYAEAHANLGAILWRGEARLPGSGGRVPRGDPAQARLRQGPLQPRHRPEQPGQARRGRSPNTARRSGSSPTTPKPTATWDLSLGRLGTLTTRSSVYDAATSWVRSGRTGGTPRRNGSPGPSGCWLCAKRFPAVLQGGDRPKDNPERLSFARMAYDHKHFAAAARLWAEALAKRPQARRQPQYAASLQRRLRCGPGRRGARQG